MKVIMCLGMYICNVQLFIYENNHMYVGRCKLNIKDSITFLLNHSINNASVWKIQQTFLLSFKIVFSQNEEKIISEKLFKCKCFEGMKM